MGIDNLFKDCSNIIEIDLSNFDSLQVVNMGYMFYGCSNLTFLNLSNFNTSSVTTMSNKFNGCKELTSLDLSNFDASKVNIINSMFSGCSSLKFLDLSNFNALQLTTINCIIHSCNNLENINLKHAMKNSNLVSSPKCSMFSPKLSICTENEDCQKLFNLSDKQYVNCINNITSFNINENEHILKCYKENIESDNPCQLCGNNYFNNNGIINNTYINCYENYYIDNTYSQISIETSINNNKNNYIDNTSFQLSIDTSINRENSQYN